MDSLPPNDPNNNNNNHDRSAQKNIPGRGPIGRNNNNSNNQDGIHLNENGEMDVFGGGNLGDQGAIMVLLLMGIASWILREPCVC